MHPQINTAANSPTWLPGAPRNSKRSPGALAQVTLAREDHPALFSGAWENFPDREIEAQTTQGTDSGGVTPSSSDRAANAAISWIHLGPSAQPCPPPEILGWLGALDGGFPQTSHALSAGCPALSSTESQEPGSMTPWGKARSAFSSLFLITFGKTRPATEEKELCVCLLAWSTPCLPVPSAVQGSEMLPRLQSERRVNRKPPASGSYRSPLLSASPLPLVQENPLGSPFKRA